jgi:hypothetical protein
MKNIHVIKPSILHLIEDTLKITKEYVNSVCDTEVNIYIPNDEPIKEGDWFIHKTNADCSLHKCIDRPAKQNVIGDNNIDYFLGFCKKIILTTDRDLIKDGVQEIDKTFLEWFVKNPSCEWVEVEKQLICENCGVEDCNNFRCRGYDNVLRYEIIIPQEEPKQETLTYKFSEEEVKHIVSEALQSALVTMDLEQWFKQFKKK